MKRIIALIIAIVMTLSFTSVFATNNVTESFMQAMMTQYEKASVKADAGFWVGGSLFDMDPELAQIRDILNGTSVTADADLVANTEMTKYQGRVKVDYNLPSQLAELIGSLPTSAEAWVDVNLAGGEENKLLMILSLLGGNDLIPEEYRDKYLVFDFSEEQEALDELAQLYRQILEILPTIYDELVPKLFKGVNLNISFDGSTYTIVMNEPQIKDFLCRILRNIVDIVAEYGYATPEEVAEAYGMIDELSYILNSVTLFSADTAYTITVGVDGANRPTYVKEKLNLSANIYDIIAAIDPASAQGGEAFRDMLWVQLSAEANAYITELPYDFSITMPELTVENSVNIIGEFKAEAEAKFDRQTPITVNYNGSPIVFDEPPMLVNDRTMVPIRALANAIGITNDNISYEETTQKITLRDDSIELIMYVGSDAVMLNGAEIVIDVPVVETNGRAYIPARYVSEFFEKNVDYVDLAENGGFGLIVNIAD